MCVKALASQTSSRWDQFQVSQSRPLQGSWGWKPLLCNICSPISLQLPCCLPSVQIVLNCCIKGFTGRVSNILRPGSGQCLWLGSWRNHGLHQNKLRNQGGTRAWRKMVLEQKQGEKSKDMSGNDSTEHSAASAKAAYNTGRLNTVPCWSQSLDCLGTEATSNWSGDEFTHYLIAQSLCSQMCPRRRTPEQGVGDVETSSLPKVTQAAHSVPEEWRQKVTTLIWLSCL